jgi:hypothetical protein
MRRLGRRIMIRRQEPDHDRAPTRDSELAEWADTLAALNVRSRGRRQNTAAMIQGFVSRND